MRQVKKTFIDPKDLPALEAATLRRILGQLAPHRGRAAVVVSCILLGSVLGLSSAWFVKRIVDVAICDCFNGPFLTGRYDSWKIPGREDYT